MRRASGTGNRRVADDSLRTRGLHRAWDDGRADGAESGESQHAAPGLEPLALQMRHPGRGRGGLAALRVPAIEAQAEGPPPHHRTAFDVRDAHDLARCHPALAPHGMRCARPSPKHLYDAGRLLLPNHPRDERQVRWIGTAHVHSREDVRRRLGLRLGDRHQARTPRRRCPAAPRPQLLREGSRQPLLLQVPLRARRFHRLANEPGAEADEHEGGQPEVAEEVQISRPPVRDASRSASNAARCPQRLRTQGSNISACE
jgi:hypothetical protein